ncbi:PH domain-containing protein [Mycolicibacterium smegmatis]|uniref:Bacterial membrane flanked domain family protein n=3 Tax=Mycolicibacterium smegmatis TaxID=1772 RepID=A0QQT0_MYCS2|nr:PH domain-containing protein [Mycolicibacterium smegmatis]ABK73919.1 bacterial membrane flanked domain family protein [Mycolicibacterium smegmatis MC2 155]AFP37325.1 Membrane-flanked domain protein [Mycolicibacterium smegmatis MC2 155]AIU06124.1 membrane protein [Mycolicibacterium smegmatis MC2 155]AIU12749.1 membrane protein [Mycolicibacterium smegmatis]AIU19373.1 membrane protein [Mycolicibacterium smegmatis]
MTAPPQPPGAGPQWQRLSPRMLLVHPVHEVLQQIPLLVGSVVLGSATGNPLWTVAAIVLTILFGLARWFTTTYRIEPNEVQLRTGVLQRKVLAVPRNRIRSVSTDARLLHRVMGLTVLRISTGQEAKGDAEFALDAVEAGQVPRLRAILLADLADASPEEHVPAGRELARWQPAWLRYSPLSFTGLAMILAAFGIVYQAGAGALMRDSAFAQSGLDAAERLGVAVSIAIVVGAVLVASVVLSVLRSLLTYGNLVLTRRDGPGGDGVLHLQHGLLRVREHTYDMRRLRGGTLREPLLVRVFGGARLDAVMTGIGGEGEASLLLPPCPAATARGVLTALIGRPDAVSGPLRPHGPAATRRRWTRALVLPVIALPVLAVVGVPVWAWVLWALVTVAAALLAADRSRALGHRVDGDWLVAQAGSVERRRDCLHTDGIIGWTVRQTLLQRRAGVATLIAATAAGQKRYEVIDVPAGQAWAIAAAGTPWIADSVWAHTPVGSDLR